MSSQFSIAGTTLSRPIGVTGPLDKGDRCSLIQMKPLAASFIPKAVLWDATVLARHRIGL